MRPSRLGVTALLTALSLPTLAACGGQDGEAAAPDREATSLPAPPSPTPSGPSQPGTTPTDPTDPSVDSATCEEVLAGVADFNTGDFDGTVDHFVDAVPLAEADLRREKQTGTSDTVQEASLLLEAVRWYADLPAEDYAEAFRTSMDFKRYQAITLGQCGNPPATPGGRDAPDDGSVEA